MSDFSFGYQSDNPNKLIKQLCGTPPYLPPEICRNQFYKPVLADMWSFGASLYVLFSGTFPFGSGDKLDPLFNRIQNAQPSFSGSKWKSISEPAKDLICKLLKKEPEERLSAAEAVDSPFIRYATLRQRFRVSCFALAGESSGTDFLHVSTVCPNQSYCDEQVDAVSR
mmetsp:Transcript_2152/g.8467  ORF Transcript_2152/g.8467 Transcript_2152/m.8467 type:complete len:168 (+) Transcript_2152:307-810(+)